MSTNFTQKPPPKPPAMTDPGNGIMRPNPQEYTAQNTDKELWGKIPGDYYAPSIHVTQGGGIGINCRGHVIVAPVETWHRCGEALLCDNERLPSWRWWLAMRLLRYRFAKGRKP